MEPNWKKIEENAERLRGEMEGWKKNPLSWEEMVAQYERLHENLGN